MTYIAYCLPSGDTWKADTAVSFGTLCARTAWERIETCQLNLRVCSVAHARNALVYDALNFKDVHITHFMWIDSDMTFPDGGLLRLLAHDKDVCGAFYPQKAHPFHTVGNPENLEEANRGTGIIRANVIGGGFVLVKREVYEKVAAPWYEERYSASPQPGLISDDTFFSHKCRADGIELWADLDLSREMGHSGNNLVRFADKS
jgi:hypothetical protein